MYSKRDDRAVATAQQPKRIHLQYWEGTTGTAAFILYLPLLVPRPSLRSVEWIVSAICGDRRLVHVSATLCSMVGCCIVLRCNGQPVGVGEICMLRMQFAFECLMNAATLVMLLCHSLPQVLSTTEWKLRRELQRLCAFFSLSQMEVDNRQAN